MTQTWIGVAYAWRRRLVNQGRQHFRRRGAEHATAWHASSRGGEGGTTNGSVISGSHSRRLAGTCHTGGVMRVIALGWGTLRSSSVSVMVVAIAR